MQSLTTGIRETGATSRGYVRIPGESFRKPARQKETSPTSTSVVCVRSLQPRQRDSSEGCLGSRARNATRQTFARSSCANGRLLAGSVRFKTISCWREDGEGRGRDNIGRNGEKISAYDVVIMRQHPQLCTVLKFTVVVGV